MLWKEAGMNEKNLKFFKSLKTRSLTQKTTLRHASLAAKGIIPCHDERVSL
jgi:hypothetical protein